MTGKEHFMEKILSALEKSGAALYQITETREESAELFFIRRALDMQRQKEIRQAAVTVYREFSEGEDRYLGSAAVQVQDSFTEEQLEQMFRDALYAAGFVKNPYYELYHGTGEPSPQVLEKAKHLSDRSLAEVAGCFADALFAEDTGKDVFLRQRCQLRRNLRYQDHMPYRERKGRGRILLQGQGNGRVRGPVHRGTGCGDL